MFGLRSRFKQAGVFKLMPVKQRKGIILAGGTGSRLYPITTHISKQLLPVYDKPLIYYPLTTLMLAGVKEILIITTPRDKELFEVLLGDGSQWGLSICYQTQSKPRGIADAYAVGRKFVGNQPSILILGDNIFYGNGLHELLLNCCQTEGATVLASHVQDAHQFGVVELDKCGVARSIEEKPTHPKSNWAITGVYFFDGAVCEMTRDVTPSSRGELEITSVLNSYLKLGKLNVRTLHRGFAWLDAGTHESLQQASEMVKTLQTRQGMLLASPEEVAFRRGLIDLQQLESLAVKLEGSAYGQSLLRIVREEQELVTQ